MKSIKDIDFDKEQVHGGELEPCDCVDQCHNRTHDWNNIEVAKCRGLSRPTAH